MAKVYLETSFISACVTTRNDVGSVYRRQTSIEWWNTQRQLHNLFLSDEVVLELSSPIYPRREEALEWVNGVQIIPATESAIRIGDLLVKERVMPAPLRGDAMHVAIAVASGMDYMLSWNVKHLANPNKLRHLSVICMGVGLVPPRIVTPELLWDESNETT
jgi:hypothetical protein